MKSKKKIKPIQPVYSLRPYQQQGVSDIRRAYKQGYRSPLYVAPTGSGKTVLFNHIAINASARGNTVLVLVHRVELIRQTSQKLHEQGIEHGIINAKFSPNPFAPVQIASVQTLVRRLGKIPLDPDLIIVDEAHHSTAKTWGNILEYYGRARVLGVTATPIRTDGTGLGEHAGGFYDELIDGPTIRSLIDGGFLVEPKVYAPTQFLDLSGVRTRMGDYAKNDLADAMDKPAIHGNAINYYRQLCDGEPAVAFCVNRAHAEHVAEEFRASGYKSWSVDGSTEDRRREALISGLSNGKVQVLTSCDLIGEGVDIPAIRAAILLRPTQSVSLYLQQIGRALRPYEGKENAIVLDHVGNCITHGLPDEERDWTLDGEEQKSSKKDEETKVRVKQCESCFGVHNPAPVCPYCGHEYKRETRKPEQVDGKLEEITEEQKKNLRRKRMAEQAKAESLEDLKRIAKQRGYRPGWAKHVWRARQQKKTG